MAANQEKEIVCLRMPQNREGRRGYGGQKSLLPGTSASNDNGPNSPVSGCTQSSKDVFKDAGTKRTSLTGLKLPKPKTEKRYLGVRVKMPVRDMLRNIRIAKGMDPKDIQGKSMKASKGDKKRVNTSGDRRNQNKRHTKGLEELAIIVEVLEEDLKASKSYRQSNRYHASDYGPEQQGNSWGEELSPQRLSLEYNKGDEMPLSPTYRLPSELSPASSVEAYNSYPSPDGSQSFTPFSSAQGGYSSDEDIRSDGQCHMACSPSSSEYQVPSPQDSVFASPSPLACGSMQDGVSDSQGRVRTQWPCSLQEWSSMAFFWAQLEREENLLKDVSDEELLALDENGRILLHRVVNEGKRALVYVVAKRMAALKKLDARDSEEKTALHLAAQRNQHLMVADLISLGARVNERDRYGKTCIHLSAEYGYVRVLEVLKHSMKDGLFVDLEATDMNGLSALQCAAVALNGAARQLERSVTAGQMMLHTLRREQMMETLECLLQMECNLHSSGIYMT